MLRISSWLAPSLTTVRPCDRPVKKTRDASNQRLPPIRTTCTRTSCVPDSLRWLPSADVPRRLRLRTTRSGDRVFHDTRDRFGGSSLVLSSSSIPSRAGDTSVGVFFPRHSGDRASDTPVANPSFILSASSSFPDVACFFVFAARPRFYGLERIGGCGDPPRPPSASSRESRYLV